MKICIFSDLHIFHHFNKTQFEDIAQAFLFHLFDYCKTNKITHVFFLGDWFHTKNKLYVPPFIKSINILRQFRDAGIKMSFLIGNHDAPQMGTTDFSVMYAFEEYGKVIPLYDWLDIDDLRIHFLSYTKELPKFEMSKKNILCAHLDIKNFAMDGGFLCNEGFDAKDFVKFNLVFSGHFHKHQVKKNIIYVGSTYQVRYSERFDDKGFIVLDTDTLDWKFETYSDAPKFKEVNSAFIDSKDDTEFPEIKGNFIRVRTHKSNQDLMSVKERLLALGAESVEFIFEDANEEKELNMIEDLTMGSMTELASNYFENVLSSDLFDKNIKDLFESKSLQKADFMDVFNEVEEAYLTNWKPEET